MFSWVHPSLDEAWKCVKIKIYLSQAAFDVVLNFSCTYASYKWEFLWSKSPLKGIRNKSMKGFLDFSSNKRGQCAYFGHVWPNTMRYNLNLHHVLVISECYTRWCMVLVSLGSQLSKKVVFAAVSYLVALKTWSITRPSTWSQSYIRPRSFKPRPKQCTQ